MSGSYVGSIGWVIRLWLGILSSRCVWHFRLQPRPQGVPRLSGEETCHMITRPLQRLDLLMVCLPGRDLSQRPNEAKR